MKFTRLRLSGFKSFVEPAEIVIEPGLTGVVGPNGCGKSNLLEALRWVMGESSYKSMRASGMDDVIFSGTTTRPARNMAEVLVTLDNSSRTAPPQFNGEETLEISRRIEREAGSAYRINGRDVRARDVQLLFADVSTGARSPALVKQGQIAELINAKPQARRLVLEEAAGITGLHTRRHDAELKLRAAEQNLARIDEVVAQLESQHNSLKRQARQAQKYRMLSAEIRKLEAAGLYAAWRDAADHVGKDEAALDAATRELAELTRQASEALRGRDAAGDALPPLREEETVRAAVLQRLTLERQQLEAEEKRAAERRRELLRRLEQIESDLARANEAIGDTDRVLARLAEEEAQLRAADEGEAEARDVAAVAMQAAADALAQAQEAADEANTRLSLEGARKATLERSAASLNERLERLEREAQINGERRRALIAETGGEDIHARLSAAVEAALAVAVTVEAEARDAEAHTRTAREAESGARQVFDDARRRADRLQTEVKTLSKLLKAPVSDLWPPLVDAIKVAPGYETALGAALGDDIEASADEGAPWHWRGLPPLGEIAALPGGAEPLARFVEAPPALGRCLAHAGIVPRELGAALQPQLLPGQRLVSREGDLWRWDGFTAAADAPSAAAKRLAERNRLESLESEMGSALDEAEEKRLAFEEAKRIAEAAAVRERERRDEARAATSAVETARSAFDAHERKLAERLAESGALEEALRRIEAALGEARTTLERERADLAALPDIEALSRDVAALRDAATGARAHYLDARGKHDGLEREAAQRAGRLAAIAAERGEWQGRAGRARDQIADFAARRGDVQSGLDELSALPQIFAEKFAKLMTMLAESERDRKAAADALAEAENVLRAADKTLREAQERLATSREDHARLEARLEASRARNEEIVRRIADTLACAPAEIAATAGFDAADIGAADEIEARCARLREDRERLGAVNLRAEEEAQEVAKKLDELIEERDDLVQAIAKLRGGIASLNREGRQRLLDAFDRVNRNFGELFSTLFGGGRAELQLIESDDPLEAGLEILAHPPGKKPTVLSLLSGGEQALTALSLIFAVFLTNPSPICVLDEVDAPLDDHNVERFCNLLDAMLERADTRFMIITHHPITMARMHRLFGVTMMERGVSQLVSVDLEQAERLREAS
jgi:chromosome segregation protein